MVNTYTERGKDWKGDTYEIKYNDTIWNGIDSIIFRISNVKAYKTKDLDSLEYFSTSKINEGSQAIMYEERDYGWTSENSSFVVISFGITNPCSNDAFLEIILC